MNRAWKWTIAAILLSAPAAESEELTSGVEVGGGIGSYSCTRVTGGEDGVKDGETLCYT
jgi:hypothetical protein